MAYTEPLNSGNKPVHHRVVIPKHVNIQLRGIVNTSIPAVFQPTAAAFRNNLEGILWTSALPYAVASTWSKQAQYHRLMASELIKAQFIKTGFNNEHAQKAEAARCVSELMASEEVMEEVQRDIAESLERLLDDRDLAIGASELLKQSLVLVWSSFEIFAGETFRVLLNSAPNLVQKLIDQEKTRRMFQLKSIPLDVLASNNFDLSQRMGDYLLTVHSVDSAISIKVIFDALLPAAPSSLDSQDLRFLNQKRHLIVHRGGIVDRGYIDATGSEVPIGSHLEVTTTDVISGMQTVHDCGVDLLSAIETQVLEQKGQSA